MTHYAICRSDTVTPSLSLSLTVNVNVHADKVLLLLVGVIWWVSRQVETTAGDIRATGMSFARDIVTLGKIATIVGKSAWWGVGL